MSIATLVIALIAAVVAWKILSGIIKFAAIAIVIAGTLWFLNSGGFGI